MLVSAKTSQMINEVYSYFDNRPASGYWKMQVGEKVRKY